MPVESSEEWSLVESQKVGSTVYSGFGRDGS